MDYRLQSMCLPVIPSLYEGQLSAFIPDCSQLGTAQACQKRRTIRPRPCGWSSAIWSLL